MSDEELAGLQRSTKELWQHAKEQAEVTNYFRERLAIEQWSAAIDRREKQLRKPGNRNVPQGWRFGA